MDAEAPRARTSNRAIGPHIAGALAVVMLIAGCTAPGDATRADAGPAPFSFTPLRVEELTARRAVIRFETSVPTSCEAEFGAQGGTLDRRATDPDMAEGETSLDHEVPLEDLAPSTRYEVLARAETADGVVARSPIVRFTTPPSDEARTFGPNVARLDAGTTVVEVSSNWSGQPNEGSWGVHNALDGALATPWSTAGDGDDAAVTLDLGRVRTLHGVGYRSRMMTDGTSIVTRIRFVLDDETVVGPFDTPDHATLYRFPIPETDARRVRFEAVASTGGNTGALEIQLYALP